MVWEDPSHWAHGADPGRRAPKRTGPPSSGGKGPAPLPPSGTSRPRYSSAAGRGGAVQGAQPSAWAAPLPAGSTAAEARTDGDVGRVRRLRRDLVPAGNDPPAPRSHQAPRDRTHPRGGGRGGRGGRGRRAGATEAAEQTPALDPEEESAVLVEGWAAMLPVFDPKTIKRVARRCSYDDGEECSVELAATIILEWASVLDDSTPLSEDPSLRRVQSALGDRRGWL